MYSVSKDTETWNAFLRGWSAGKVSRTKENYVFSEALCFLDAKNSLDGLGTSEDCHSCAPDYVVCDTLRKLDRTRTMCIFQVKQVRRGYCFTSGWNMTAVTGYFLP